MIFVIVFCKIKLKKHQKILILQKPFSCVKNSNGLKTFFNYILIFISKYVIVQKCANNSENITV